MHALGRACGFFALGTLLPAGRLAAQVLFSEVGTARGILTYHMADGQGGGAALSDYDNDGFIDIFVPQAAPYPDQLYHNLGNGNFVEVAASLGLASTFNNREALWLDYDGDGKLDLLVADDVTGAVTSYRLYRQLPSGSFEDRTVQAGLFIPPVNPGTHQRGGICAGDINNDRYLDIVAAVYNGPIHVFLNNTNGTFTNISVSSGIGVSSQFAHQPVMADFNQDGWMDVYVAVDFLPNFLFMNQRNNTFINQAAQANAAMVMNDMGVAVGDYDNDGDFDIYVTNIYDTDPQSLLPEYNVLLRNDTTSAVPLFTDVAHAPGANVSDGGWGWGTTFFDFDNNGYLDIAATNGWRSGPWVGDPTRLFLNAGTNPPTLTNVASACNFADIYYGSCLLAFDFDRDGDLDVLQTCQAVDDNPSNTHEPSRVRLLLNTPTGASGHYLVVRPRMKGPNSQAIGAVVKAQAGSLSMMRLITAGTSYLGQEPAEAFFGLATNTNVATVVVQWPDGSATTLSNVAADQVLNVTHGGFGDLDADGDVDEADIALFTPCYTGPGPGGGVILYGTGCRAADMNGDGDVDCGDWLYLSNAYAAVHGHAPLPNPTLFVAALLGVPSAPVQTCFADVNRDGLTNGRDVQAYVDATITP